LGIAARQVSGKGILETIKTLRNLPAHFPEISLEIIGQATAESAKWKEEGLYGRIQVKSVSTDADLSEWFSSLDLYLMPSTAWESQPNSLIEAIAIGCPVLCSNRFDLEIELPESNLFDPLDPKSLERSLAQIFDRSGEEISNLSAQLKLYIQHSNDAIFIKSTWISLIEKAISKETT
jgi:glycosyltransferase involved in cell wall biosynthesis